MKSGDLEEICRKRTGFSPPFGGGVGEGGRALAGWGLAVCAGLLLLFSGECMEAARETAAVFASGVMPALFPMMVLAGLPWGQGKSSEQGGWREFWGTALFAFAAGSPAGARRVAALGGKGPLAPRFVTAGVMSPLFFLGSMAGWTRNQGAMAILLGLHWGCALLAGALAWGMQRLSSPLACPSPVMRMQPPIQPSLAHQEKMPRSLEKDASAVPPPAAAPSLAGALPEAIAAAARALLSVCGAMMLFAVAAAVLRGVLLRLWPGWAQAGAMPLALLHAFLEIGGGAYALIGAAGSAAVPGQVLYPLLCAACSFGGLSIWLQNLAYTGQSIRPGALLLYRAVHGALSFGLCWVVFQLWPQAATAGALGTAGGAVLPPAGLSPGAPGGTLLAVGLLLALASFGRRSKTC